MSAITELLKSYHANTLIDMAQAAGMTVKDKHGKRLRKSVLLKEMEKHYFTESRVKASWEKLSDAERAIVNRLLLHNDATVSTHTFRREIVRAGLAKMPPESKQQRSRWYHSGAPYAVGSYTGSPFRRDSQVFEDVIARLTLHGIVFSKIQQTSYSGVSYKLQFHPGDVLFIPEEVRRYLPPPQEIPSELKNWKPRKVVEGTSEVLLRDLYLYWDFVRSHSVTLIKSGFVGKRWLKAINKILLSPDHNLGDGEKGTRRLYLLRTLLMGCDLLVEIGNALLTTNSDDPARIPDFWGLSRLEQRARLLKAWATSDAGNGLQGADQYVADYARARKVFYQILGNLPTDTWLSLSDIMAYIQGKDTMFLFPGRREIERRRARYYGYGYSYSYTSPQQILDKLDSYEEQFVLQCLTGFLHEIGLIELGYGEDDTPSGFRLPKSALPLLTGVEGKGEEIPEDEAGKLILQPNFQLMALGPVRFDLLATIDLFADRERVDVAAFEYRISRQSVYRAQQVGLEASSITRFLEQHCEAGIPQNVRRSLDEWDAHHKRIVFRADVPLVQAADEDLLRSLFDDQAIGKHLERLVTPTIALARSGSGKSLVAALVKKGLFPAISGSDPGSADGSVTVDAEGHIKAIHAVPSIYLDKRLGDIAFSLGPGEWRLDPIIIKRVGGSREKVQRVLKELEALSRNPLPEAIVERIKAWGGYYGRAHIATVTIIEFHSRAAMEELLSHPALKPYLKPFPTKDRALAIVPTEELERVREILGEQFGVRITEGLRRR